MATQSFNLLLPSLESELVAGEEVATCLLHGFLLAFEGKFTRFFFSRVSDNHRRHRFFFGGGAKIGITSDDKDEFFVGVILTGGETGGKILGKKIRERERHTQKVSRISVFLFVLLVQLRKDTNIHLQTKHFARKVGGVGVMATQQKIRW